MTVQNAWCYNIPLRTLHKNANASERYQTCHLLAGDPILQEFLLFDSARERVE
jgi:hypothetical protein